MSKSDKTIHLSEILNHLGENRSKYFNAVSPPIIQTSNFAYPNTAAFRTAFLDERASHLYTRGNNPTTEILREKLAALEGAEDSLVFGSGAAAMACAVLANVKAGDHVICVRNPYSWTNSLVINLLMRFGITHTFISGDDLDELEQAINPKTSILILESPNSITFGIQDLAGCSKICKQNKLISIIDNTYCSPLYQNPIEFGIDIVMHTGSKYLNGHSDVVAGVLCSSKKMMDKIFYSEFMTLGSILSPNDAGMMIRGLRTLEIRMERISATGLTVANYLESHPKIESVLHPLLSSFPQQHLAKSQMRGAGGLFSVILRAGCKEDVNRMVDKLRHFLLAVSWGGHESLVLPFSIFHDMEGKENPVHPFNLVRIYVGLEEPAHLIDDLSQALEVL